MSGNAAGGKENDAEEVKESEDIGEGGRKKKSIDVVRENNGKM